MSFRSTKAFSEKYKSDFTNSNEVNLKKDETFNQYKNHKNQEANKITECRSAINLLEGKKGLD